MARLVLADTLHVSLNPSFKTSSFLPYGSKSSPLAADVGRLLNRLLAFLQDFQAPYGFRGSSAMFGRSEWAAGRMPGQSSAFSADPVKSYSPTPQLGRCALFRRNANCLATEWSVCRPAADMPSTALCAECDTQLVK